MSVGRKQTSKALHQVDEHSEKRTSSKESVRLPTIPKDKDEEDSIGDSPKKKQSIAMKLSRKRVNVTSKKKKYKFSIGAIKRGRQQQVQL